MEVELYEKNSTYVKPEDGEPLDEDTRVVHKGLYAGFVVTTFLAPYVSGLIILTCKNKLTKWNWL